MNNPYDCIINVPIYANKLCFNIIQSAPAYSQLAAILASFVFAAIILALGSPPKNKTVRDISLPLVLSFGTFISFLLSSYFHATLSGEETQVVAFAFAYSASLIFTFAALQLLLGIAWYFKKYDVEPSVIAAANWLIEIVLLIIVLHVISVSGDLRIITINASWDQAWFNIPWLNVWVVLAIQIILIYLFPSGIAWIVRRKKPNLQNEVLSRITVLIFIGLTAFFAVYGAVMVEFDEQKLKKDIGIIQQFHGVEIILCFIFLIFALFIFLYKLSLPSKEQAKEADLTQKPTPEVEVIKELTSEVKKLVGNVQAEHQISVHQSKRETQVQIIQTSLLVGFSVLSCLLITFILGRSKRKPL